MRDITVLTTACGSNFMPGFFSCLRQNGERNITIIGTDIIDDTVMELFVDRYYKVPTFHSEEYVDILLSICEQNRVDIFFPQISMELPIIRERLEEFEKIGVKVAINENENLEIANSKYQMYEYMNEHNLVVPQYYLVKNREDLCAGAEKMGYPNKPICVKLSKSSGSRGVRIVRPGLSMSTEFLNKKPSSMNIAMEDMCEIIDECGEEHEIIAMEYIPGCEYTVDLLADHGQVNYIAGRRNSVSFMSIAQQSIIEKKEKAYEIATNIVSLLELDGNIGFDFMLDENDAPILTDINPRVTATIVIYLAAGINFPYLRIKQLLGETMPDVNVSYGARLVRKYNDILINADGSKYLM